MIRFGWILFFVGVVLLNVANWVYSIDMDSMLLASEQDRVAYFEHTMVLRQRFLIASGFFQFVGLALIAIHYLKKPKASKS